MSRVTIRDVARAAGVSHPVVSAVLGRNKSSTVRVSEETRARVLEAADTLKYTPSLVGRGLRHNLSYLVGVLVSEVNWMVAVELLRGVQEALLQQQYSMVVQIHDSLESETQEARQLLQRQVDGMLVNCWAHSGSESARAWPTESGVPRIELLGSFLADCPSAEVDFHADGAAAVRHLLELGHRRIVLLTHSNYRDRRQFPTAASFADGYTEALDEAGLAPLVCSFDLKGVGAWETQCVAAGERMLRHVANHEARPTAVVCFNDYCAFGLLRAAPAAGVRIPEDLSVIGHYDAEMTSLTYPGLTTLRIPMREIGFTAGEMLFSALRGEDVASRKLASSLVLRYSTAPPGRN